MTSTPHAEHGAAQQPHVVWELAGEEDYVPRHAWVEDVPSSAGLDEVDEAETAENRARRRWRTRKTA